MTKQPSIGRIVNYVPTEEEKAKWNGADIVPAIITRVWSVSAGMVNLQVFADAPNCVWKTSVEMSGNKAACSWHWPEIKKAE